MKRFLIPVAAFLHAFVGPGVGRVQAQCGLELNDCYDFHHYLYQGHAYCWRFPSGTFRQFGVRGSLPGISGDDIGLAAYGAWNEWNLAVPVGLEYVGPDTSGTKCKFAVINNTLFSSNWGPATTGATSVTFLTWNSDSTIKLARTYIRGANPTYDWVLDCTPTPSTCSPLSDMDVRGTITHEMGHWWFLGEVGPPLVPAVEDCDSVTMWFQAINSNAFKRTVADWDIAGANQLYDSDVSVGPSFMAFPGPSEDTLRWEESDPSGFHNYQLEVSDACWGPHTFLGTVHDGDPAHTPDGRFYTFISPAPYRRPYHYVMTSNQGSSRTTSNRTQGLTASPPSVPTSVNATVNASAGGVEVTWAASSGSVDGYYVYRHWLHLTDCDVGRQAPWVTFGPLASTALFDATPSADDSLFYYVRAVNSTGGTGLSNEAGVHLGPFLDVGETTRPGAAMRIVGPNPTRGIVTLEYDLPEAGEVQISVYDIAGRVVMRPLREWRAAGSHRVEFSVRGVVADGASVYFVGMRFAGQDESGRRVVVLR